MMTYYQYLQTNKCFDERLAMNVSAKRGSSEPLCWVLKIDTHTPTKNRHAIIDITY